MNIYFSCSLTGGRNDEAVYGLIVEHLLRAGHDLPTAHLAHPDVMTEEASIDPRVVYARDKRWMAECQALVAEVSTPSHGVGYEIAYVLGLGKPVLCCYWAGARVSKMITGNQEPGICVRSYVDGADALRVIDEFIEKAGG